MLEARQTERDRRIDDHSEETKREADDHRPEAPVGVEALEKHAQEEHDEDGRREVPLHGLQVVVEAVGRLDNGDPEERDQNHDGGRAAPDPHELGLRCGWSPLFVEIDGEESRARVEDTGERSHERRQQSRDHNPTES